MIKRRTFGSSDLRGEPANALSIAHVACTPESDTLADEKSQLSEQGKQWVDLEGHNRNRQYGVDVPTFALDG